MQPLSDKDPWIPGNWGLHSPPAGTPQRNGTPGRRATYVTWGVEAETCFFPVVVLLVNNKTLTICDLVFVIDCGGSHQP
jgi:hypothetical protein